MTLVLFTLISFNSYSQVGITKSLSEIKETNVDGKLQMNPNGGFIYYYDNTNVTTYFVYFLDSKFECYTTQVRPYSKMSYKFWKKNLNESWNDNGKNKWKIHKYDGTIIYCKLKKDVNKKPIFIFSKNDQ